MSTPDYSDQDTSVEKLDSLVDFASQFSSNTKKTIYDTILIDDPFKRREAQKGVPDKHKEQIKELINEFELSLERVSVSVFAIECKESPLTVTEFKIHLERDDT